MRIAILTVLLGLAFWGVSSQPAHAQNRGRLFGGESSTDFAEPPPEPKHGVSAPESAWAAGLNQYFDSNLSNPTPDEVMAAVATHLNQRTLYGAPPGEEFERFEEWMKRFRKSLPKDEVETEPVLEFYRNLARWVELEAEYNEKPNRSVLKDLIDLVEDQAIQDPTLDAERRERIISTIDQQGLFVPSSILFGLSVLPYREMELPREFTVFEVLGTPLFDDAPGRTQATYDFIECPGPVFRVDFDTVATRKLTVENGAEKNELKLIAEIPVEEAPGVRGPVILRKPVAARFLRVTAESAQDMAVLRNVRVFALKEPTAAICPSAATAPVLDASFRESPWPQDPQVRGFVTREGPAFAEAQTTVRLCRTKDTLFLAIYAREPRMDTMLARMTAKDSPLWSEESFEFSVQPAGRPVFRFIVNPKGARYDSRDGDQQWDGEWQAVTKTYPEGWAAEIAIPFATLGGLPTAGKDWAMDCVRVRRNVKNERSAWAYAAKGSDTPGGSLIFD
ncbi:MAG: hypothetical protein IT365_24025 [Candidatus Hydrogenedentes bacterium]|nr:hypothetical protein [Candidatus Hydrogenedentota bacterium]